MTYSIKFLMLSKDAAGKTKTLVTKTKIDGNFQFYKQNRLKINIAEKNMSTKENCHSRKKSN